MGALRLPRAALPADDDALKPPGMPGTVSLLLLEIIQLHLSSFGCFVTWSLQNVTMLLKAASAVAKMCGGLSERFTP